MTLLGIHIGLRLLLQLVSTTIIIGIYAVITSLHEQKADHISDCQTVILASFLFKYHPTVKDLKALTEASEDDIKDPQSSLYYFSPRLHEYVTNGKLPEFKLAAQTNLWEHLWMVLLSPFVPIGLLLLVNRDDERQNVARIKHPEIRKNYFSKGIILLAANILWLAIVTELLRSSWSKIAMIIIAIGIIGIAASLMYLWRLVVQQQGWKGYWSDRMLEIMAVAEKDGNHDLFNRAMILNIYIDSQPDIPIPGRLAYYAAVYSAVQAVIIFASRTWNFS
jgi:hypothetical protein